MSTASTSTRKTGWLRENWLALTLGGFVIFVVVGFIYFQSTRVSGLELNLKTFQLRKFSFHRDPFSNAQLSGIKYSNPGWYPNWNGGNNATASTSIDAVIFKHLDSTVANSWDLVDFDGTMATADAQIFLDLMAAEDPEGNYFWTEWTKKHPMHASIFWPQVQQLALQSNYSYLPGLFEFVSGQDLDVDSFKQEIDVYMDKVASQPSPPAESTES